MNPGHPLFSGAERAANEIFERPGHLCQSTPTGTEYDADAWTYDSDAQLCGLERLRLPSAAKPAKKIISCRGLFGKELIVPRAVTPDRRCADEDLRLLLGFRARLHQNVGGIDAALLDPASLHGRPFLCGNRLPG